MRPRKAKMSKRIREKEDAHEESKGNFLKRRGLKRKLEEEEIFDTIEGRKLQMCLERGG